MAITMNTVILRTPTGLLKILEIVLVLICLFLCRFGGHDQNPFSIGSSSDHFLAVGTFVGFAIIVPAILLTYLLGANLTILELMIHLVGFALFLTTGILSIVNNKNYRRNNHDHNMGLALGVLCIITATVFLVDFILAMKNTRITVIQTRAVAM
jgi:hypothetical protein